MSLEQLLAFRGRFCMDLRTRMRFIGYCRHQVAIGRITDGELDRVLDWLWNE